MPLSIMNEINLQITKHYRDLYLFYSKRVKCVGLIKDIVVSLEKIPTKNIVMYEVVANILALFAMLLSRSWGEKFGGVIKLDFTYAIIPVFNGEERRLYRETRFVKTTSKKDAGNSPIYSQEIEDISCFMLHEDAEFVEDTRKQLSSTVVNNELHSRNIWKCFLMVPTPRKAQELDSC